MKSDTQIQQEVLQELKWDSRVEPTNVGVEVQKGTVTLTGTVDTYFKRWAAQEAAHRVFGVQDVANDINVKVAGEGIPNDTEIAQAVRQALKWDVLVPEEDIQSTVSDRWVTLTGKVDRISQREDAERAIRHLTGVRGVNNLIKVIPATVAPETVREAIETALERRADRDAGRIAVAVRDGTVTLSGNVASWAEKRAVLGAAGHAPGVTEVDDQLEIRPFA